MIRRKMFGTVIGVMAMGVAAMPLAASAAANTTGLVPIALQGVGTGSLSAGNCSSPAITCKSGHTCECLTGAETVLGNQGFNRGSLVFNLSIDETSSSLPIADQGDCLPATGFATLSNTTGKLTVSMDVSGLACPTADGDAEVFNGAYFVTNGTAPGVQKPFTTGTGSLNGSLAGTAARISLSGNVQKN